MKQRTRAVVPDRAAWRLPARRLAALRLLAVLVVPGPFVAAQATVWTPLTASPRTVDAAAAGGRSALAAPTGGTPSRGSASELREGEVGRHDTGRDPRAAATRPASPASAAGERSVSLLDGPDGRLPISQTWALVGGGLLAVCMIARRQRRQG